MVEQLDSVLQNGIDIESLKKRKVEVKLRQCRNPANVDLRDIHFRRITGL